MCVKHIVLTITIKLTPADPSVRRSNVGVFIAREEIHAEEEIETTGTLVKMNGSATHRTHEV